MNVEDTWRERASEREREREREREGQRGENESIKESLFVGEKKVEDGGQ